MKREPVEEIRIVKERENYVGETEGGRGRVKAFNCSPLLSILEVTILT